MGKASAKSGPNGELSATEKLCDELEYATRGFRIRMMATAQSFVAGRGITVPQLAVLDILVRKGKCSMGELDAELMLTTSAVTNLVNKLHQGGFVSRERSAKDRRVVLVSPTPKGKRELMRVHNPMRKLFTQILARLGVRQGRRLVQLYHQMTAIMDNIPLSNLQPPKRNRMK